MRTQCPASCLILLAVLAPSFSFDLLPAENTITGTVLAERKDRRGETELVLAVPSHLNGVAITEVRLGMDGGLAQKLEPAKLPPGWVARKGALLSGPALSDPVLAASFKARGLKLPRTVEIELKGGGARLFQGKRELGKLPAVRTAISPHDFVRLPQLIAAGEPVTFRALWPEVGGKWEVGGQIPIRNGDFEDTHYTFSLPSDTKLPLSIKYIDPWGETLLDGAANDVQLSSSRTPGAAAALTGCSPKVLTGSTICVCGYFPTEASRKAITVNGKPFEDLLVSASSFVLNFKLPPDLTPGTFIVEGLPEGGFAPPAQASGLYIGVHGDIDRNRLLRGESTPLRLFLEGTTEPIGLHLWNSTPQIVSLEGGDDQVVKTSGGEKNEAVRTVHAESPGDFSLSYELSLGSCPCSENGFPGPVYVEQTLERPLALPRDGASQPPAVKPDPCAQIRKRLEEARAKRQAEAEKLRERQTDPDFRDRTELERLKNSVNDLDATIQKLTEEYTGCVNSAGEAREKERREAETRPPDLTAEMGCCGKNGDIIDCCGLLKSLYQKLGSTAWGSTKRGAHILDTLGSYLCRDITFVVTVDGRPLKNGPPIPETPSVEGDDKVLPGNAMHVRTLRMYPPGIYSNEIYLGVDGSTRGLAEADADPSKYFFCMQDGKRVAIRKTDLIHNLVHEAVHAYQAGKFSRDGKKCLEEEVDAWEAGNEAVKAMGLEPAGGDRPGGSYPGTFGSNPQYEKVD